MNKTVVKGINSIYLPVSNPHYSANWYVMHLGMKLLMAVQPDSVQAQLGFPNGQSLVLIQTKHSRNANFIEIGGSEQCPLTIEVENFEEAFKELTSAGVRTSPIEDNKSCGKNFYAFDPDGNKIDIWSGWPIHNKANLDRAAMV